MTTFRTGAKTIEITKFIADIMAIRAKSNGLKWNWSQKIFNSTTPLSSVLPFLKKVTPIYVFAEKNQVGDVGNGP